MILNFRYNIPSHITVLNIFLTRSSAAAARKLLDKEAESIKKYQLKVFRCFHCNTRIVVMRTSTGSVLPVEVTGEVGLLITEIFDHKKHTSHLKKCVKLRMEWERKKKRFLRTG